jgi:hypothetical protein
MRFKNVGQIYAKVTVIFSVKLKDSICGKILKSKLWSGSSKIFILGQYVAQKYK